MSGTQRPAAGREPRAATGRPGGAVVEFDRVTKRYGRQVALDGISFRVPAGSVCALVGPSGCGKTTTLKLVNRLVEPTSGRVLLDGEDVASRDPVELRRGIGYVIQQVGLFPHRTVAENVATVPRLLGWDRARVRRRVDELVELVGLDPARYRDRYPSQLSGGERQRVGVARALAVDPPVLLMDEPFGAVDPLTRERLQNELLRLHRQIGTTILLVTHDVDEAVKVGDHVAVFAPGGVLAQFSTAQAVLESPASDYVARFVGADRGLKRLSLSRVRDVPLRDPVTAIPGEDARAVARRLEAAGAAYLLLVDTDGRPLGWVSRKELLPGGPVSRSGAVSPEPLLELDSTLRDALSGLLSSAVQEGVVLDERGRVAGVLSIEALSSVLRQEATVRSGP